MPKLGEIAGVELFDRLLVIIDLVGTDWCFDGGVASNKLVDGEY